MLTCGFDRQVMEIKPSWLMEGKCSCSVAHVDLAYLSSVAPHYFKAADLEQLATGEKKMPKGSGYSGVPASSTS